MVFKFYENMLCFMFVVYILKFRLLIECGISGALYRQDVGKYGRGKRLKQCIKQVSGMQ